MHNVTINGKTYSLEINLGVLEDLEKRGHKITELSDPDGISFILQLDILELGAGVPREELRKYRRARAVIAAITAELEEVFSLDEEEEYSGENSPGE